MAEFLYPFTCWWRAGSCPLLVIVNHTALSMVYKPGFFLKQYPGLVQHFLGSPLSHLSRWKLQLMKFPNTHNATLPSKVIDSPQPATQNIALRLCRRFELYNVVCLAMIKNQDGWRWNRQTTVWKSCGLSTSLSILHFILELNWTVRDKMLWPNCLVLSAQPQFPGRTALVMFDCHDLPCQEKLPHGTDSGKLWRHIFLRCSRHNNLSMPSICHELENTCRVKH